MTVEQEINIILDESEEKIAALSRDQELEKLNEKANALKECVILLGRKLDENSDYIVEIYKEISKLKEKL